MLNALKARLFFTLLIFTSCAFGHKNEGSYSAFIFEKPIYNENQPHKLYKEKNVILKSHGCGLQGINIENLSRAMLKKYVENYNNQIVGIADVEIESYYKFIGITVIPCLQMKALPLTVENTESKILFPIEFNIPFK